MITPSMNGKVFSTEMSTFRLKERSGEACNASRVAAAVNDATYISFLSLSLSLSFFSFFSLPNNNGKRYLVELPKSGEGAGGGIP